MALLLRRGDRPVFKWQPQQFEQGASTTLPAPYGGLNLRSDITAMAPNEARVLENWIADSGYLYMREGTEAHGTGLAGSSVRTVAAFFGLTSSRIIGSGSGALYNATSAGSATSLASGFTSDWWQTALYNNRLQFVNGADAPQVYDGSTIGAAGWSGSGLTATNLVNVGLSRNRLWFCENNSADVWYGGIGSITGTLTKFQLSQIADGGVCTAIGAWSRDAGDGADDVTVMVMSTGQVIIYQGDPATDFTLAGKYMAAPPIGRRCLIKVGGELVVITRLGLLPVSAATGGAGQLNLAAIDPWGKIAPGIAEDTRLHGDKIGWSGLLHEGFVYVTVPLSDSNALSKQYVLNVRNGSWSTTTGYNGIAWASFGGTIYFGAATGGKLLKVGGTNDLGADIAASANGAFVMPSGASRTNLFTAIRPKVQADGTVAGYIGVDTDYVIRAAGGNQVNIVDDPSSTPWGSEWGSPWGRRGEAQSQWYTIRGLGRAVSVRLRATGSSQNLRWFATDLVYKPGGIR